MLVEISIYAKSCSDSQYECYVIASVILFFSCICNDTYVRGRSLGSCSRARRGARVDLPGLGCCAPRLGRGKGGAGGLKGGRSILQSMHHIKPHAQ